MKSEEETAETLALLREIRDHQMVAIEQQREHLEVAKDHLARSRAQVEESIGLQRFAIDRFKKVSMIAAPLLLLCLGLIAYLMVKYF